jgi:RimJ/RimL family protein N-acetyltransferase
MTSQPNLISDRLLMRPFTLKDAPDVQRLAGDRAIAYTTQNVPHPYEDGMAETWIGSHRERFEKGQFVTFAVALRDDTLIGAISLHLNQDNERAELGYWIGKPYWGQGYCTEAARAVLQYGFEMLGLNRIHARHLARNPASGRVMQKIGMRHEGSLRKHAKKWGVFEDIEVYGILRDEHAKASPG